MCWFGWPARGWLGGWGQSCTTRRFMRSYSQLLEQSMEPQRDQARTMARDWFNALLNTHGEAAQNELWQSLRVWLGLELERLQNEKDAEERNLIPELVSAVHEAFHDVYRTQSLPGMYQEALRCHDAMMEFFHAAQQHVETESMADERAGAGEDWKQSDTMLESLAQFVRSVRRGERPSAKRPEPVVLDEESSAAPPTKRAREGFP